MFVPDLIAIGSLFLALNFSLGLLFAKKTAFSLSYIAGLIVLAALYSYLLARMQYSIAKRNGATFILKKFSVRSLDLKKSADRLCQEIADDVQKKAGLAKINIYIISGRGANALAIIDPEGTPSLALTEGLLGEFNREEIMAVIAREMAGIIRGDTLYKTLLCSLGDFLERIQYSFDLKGQNEGPSSFSLSSALRRYLSRYIRQERDILADVASVEYGANPVNLAQAIARASAQDIPVEHLDWAYAPLLFVPPGSAGKNENRAGWLASISPPSLTRVRRLAILAGQKTEEIIPSEIFEILKKGK